MTSDDAGIRKAAILVSSLDRTTAKLLLRQLGLVDAQRVCQVMGQLGAVDPQERRRVLEEFFRTEPAPREEPPRRTVAPPAPAPPPAESSAAPRFAFLRDVDPADLAFLLARERPQTVALVLAHLSAEQSGGVLAALEPSLQVEVLRRLAELEETDAEIVSEIEQVLRERVAQAAVPSRRRAAGVAAMAGVLAAGAGFGPPAAAPEPEPLAWDDLPRLDDATLGAIAREAEPELLLLALLGASPSLVLRILRCFSPAEAAWLRGRLENPGPTRLRDVEQARAELALLASRRTEFIPSHPDT